MTRVVKEIFDAAINYILTAKNFSHIYRGISGDKTYYVHSNISKGTIMVAEYLSPEWINGRPVEPTYLIHPKVLGYFFWVIRFYFKLTNITFFVSH